MNGHLRRGGLKFVDKSALVLTSVQGNPSRGGGAKLPVCEWRQRGCQGETANAGALIQAVREPGARSCANVPSLFVLRIAVACTAQAACPAGRWGSAWPQRCCALRTSATLH